MDAQPLVAGSHLPMEGVFDHRGRQITSRSTSGGWRSALFIIGSLLAALLSNSLFRLWESRDPAPCDLPYYRVSSDEMAGGAPGVEIAERFAFYGVSSNLITYLTGPLGVSTASAAAEVNAWNGVGWLLPLVGGFLADSCIGRYRTIVFASLLYVLGLGMLTLSAAVPPFRPPRCSRIDNGKACLPTRFQVAFFFFSLYLVAFAQGGHKPCVQAFGADQFDEKDPEECKSRSSFFNWWYFGMCGGATVTLLLCIYVQDNIGWGLGFGLPCIAMATALIIFLMGNRTYRYHILSSKSPFTELGQAYAKLSKAFWKPSSLGRTNAKGPEAEKTLLPEVVSPTKSVDGCQCSSLREQDHKADEAETLHGLLRLFPIWATCLLYAVAFAQLSTFFTKQGSTMDRRIGPSFLVPPAALQSLISISIVTFIPIYDRIFVPITRTFTGIPSGVTMLQRIGIGLFFSVLSLVIAALVEMRRLQTARDFGLVDLPKATVPMSLWWLAPQYVLCGISEVFTMVGLQEFFYDQVSDGLRSVGLALYLSIFGIGNFISSLLVSVIDKVSRSGGESWLSNNLNRAHLDYFYWLISGLSAVQLVIYVYFAQAFHYKTKGNGTA